MPKKIIDCLTLGGNPPRSAVTCAEHDSVRRRGFAWDVLRRILRGPSLNHHHVPPQDSAQAPSIQSGARVLSLARRDSHHGPQPHDDLPAYRRRALPATRSPRRPSLRLAERDAAELDRRSRGLPGGYAASLIPCSPSSCGDFMRDRLAGAARRRLATASIGLFSAKSSSRSAHS